MRRLILLPLVAAVLLVGCDGGVLGGGKIENYGGNPNCRYQGGIAEGLPHGQGKFSCVFHGEGRVTVYEGGWKYGKYHGQGTITYSSGAKYVGEWKNDRPNGQGTEYNTDGSIGYQGEWCNGQKYPCG